MAALRHNLYTLYTFKIIFWKILLKYGRRGFFKFCGFVKTLFGLFFTASWSFVLKLVFSYIKSKKSIYISRMNLITF